MHYPINLNLKNKTVLVIGGGKVAFRKIKQLIPSKAKIICIAKTLGPSIKKLQKIKTIKKAITLTDITKYNPLVIINASGDPKVDKQILNKIKTKNILYNSVDKPESCNFFVPAIVKKKNLIISISTQGHAPIMASYIKDKISKSIKKEWIGLIEKISKLRKKLKNSGLSSIEKKKIYRKIINNQKIRKD